MNAFIIFYGNDQLYIVNNVKDETTLKGLVKTSEKLELAKKFLDKF